MFKNKKIWKRIIWGILFIPILFISLLIIIVYWQQDAIVQQLLNTVNKDFKGEIQINDSHISPFENFPYISIDLEDVKLYENKLKKTPPLLRIKDVYLGFEISSLLSQEFEIKLIKLSKGNIDIVQDKNGEFNITKAFTTENKIENVDKEFHLDIKSILLNDIDFTKLNEENKILVEAFIYNTESKFKTSNSNLSISLESSLLLNVLKNNDTTFFKHKHVKLKSSIIFDKENELLTIETSELNMEKAIFGFEGNIDIKDSMNLNIKIQGNKPNFDLFIAFAPEEIVPALEKYDQSGKVYFEALLKGKIANGNQPYINVNFGCENAFFKNTNSQKKLDQLYFKGHFTNGSERKLSTMEFSLIDFSARPEAGTFTGFLKVKNFESPDIQTKIKSEFDLDFLSNFLNLKDLKNLKGNVNLTMNFHDIIDLNMPEKAIEKFNESYFTELLVENLSFESPDFHLPIHDIDVKITVDGHKAKVDYFNAKIGKSDISISGEVSDLPAILHHNNNIVKSNLLIKSNFIDLFELTNTKKTNSKPIDEQLEKTSLSFSFISKANTFSNSKTLPIGEFFIDNLNTKFNHYPHKLHDFHADVLIEEQDFRIIDFNGIIDKSDFHFNGKLKNYNIWFEDKPKGDTKIEFSINSKMLKLEDLFAYKGENYVPEDYRHEIFKNLNLSAIADLNFNDSLYFIDVVLQKFSANMKIHPLKIEELKGRIHYQNEHLLFENFYGKLGNSNILANLQYYTGSKPDLKKKDNYLYLKSSHIDFDELFKYNPPPVSNKEKTVDHEAIFNIYDLPFTDMSISFDIKYLNYHKYLIKNFYSKLRIQRNHYIYVDTLNMGIADGTVNMNGYFNGSDKNKIYLNPKIIFNNIDLEKLMFKFDNFGQDEVLSDNLNGKLSGQLTGKIHVHPDLVIKIDDSEINMSVQIVNGKLKHYKPLDALTDYFKDKNLNNVLFDTLSNNFSLKNGIITVPNMVINSSLGFLEISGKQDMSMNMEYYLKIPCKLVTQIAKQKLNITNNDDNISGREDEDEIQYKNNQKKIRYINLKLTSTEKGYSVSLGKERSNIRK